MKKLGYVASLKPHVGFKKEIELISFIIDDLRPQDIASILGADPEHVSVDCRIVMAELRARIRERLVKLAEAITQPG